DTIENTASVSHTINVIRVASTDIVDIAVDATTGVARVVFSFVHPLTHSFAHSFVHSLVHLEVHPIHGHVSHSQLGVAGVYANPPCTRLSCASSYRRAHAFSCAAQA